MTVSRPSRPSSAMRAQTLLVPTSMATSVPWTTPTSDVVPPDQSDVVEDPEPEVDERHQVQVEAEPIADEGEDDGHDGVGHEARDEDPVVVDAVELGPHGPEDRVERCEDRNGRVAAELEADVDVEDEPEQDAHQQACQGEEHGARPYCEAFPGRLLDPRRAGQANAHVGPPSPRRLHRDVGAVLVVGEDDSGDPGLATEEQAPQQ